MFHPIDKCNLRLRNALDVDLKITRLQNVQSKYFSRACDNGENNSDHKIDASMARMSSNDECPSENFGDSLQLTNWILDSGAMCHMTP